MKEEKCKHLQEKSSWYVFPVAKTINFYCTLHKKFTDYRTCGKCEKKGGTKAKTYIDRLKTRNRVEYETRRYYYTAYEDFFMGEWFGNVNVFDKRKPEHFVLHATLEEPMTLDELKQYAEEYENSI